MIDWRTSGDSSELAARSSTISAARSSSRRSSGRWVVPSSQGRSAASRVVNTLSIPAGGSAASMPRRMRVVGSAQCRSSIRKSRRCRAPRRPTQPTSAVSVSWSRAVASMMVAVYPAGSETPMSGARYGTAAVRVDADLGQVVDQPVEADVLRFVVQSEGALDQRGDWPQGDVGVVGLAATGHRVVGVIGRMVAELGGEPALADAGLPGDDDDPPHSSTDLVPGLHQPIPRLVAAVQSGPAQPGGLEPAGDRAHSVDREHLDVAGDALELAQPEGRDVEVSADQLMGDVAHHHHARFGLGLEAGGQVGGDADDRMTLPGVRGG